MAVHGTAMLDNGYQRLITTAAEVMTRDPVGIPADESIRQAAMRMADLRSVHCLSAKVERSSA
jgi:CBS domain-containing protein